MIKYKNLIPDLTLDEFFENNKDKVETRAISFYLNPKNQLLVDKRVNPTETHNYTGIFIDFREYDKSVDNIIPYGRICVGSAKMIDAFMGSVPYFSDTIIDNPNTNDIVMLWVRKIADIEKSKMANNGLNFIENFYKFGLFTNETK
jgi:hypothetical protein